MKNLVRKIPVVLMGVLMCLGAITTACAEDQRVIGRLIEALEVGERVYYENLTIIPVYSVKKRIPRNYLTLDEAIKNNWLEITELQGGRVPEVNITNVSDRYIYIMGGEILTGCKQDRIVGRDLLISPKAKNVAVPVYCVEQGRWTLSSGKFYSKGNLGTPRLRASAQYSAPDSQNEIWSEVGKLNRDTKTNSRTQAYQELYDNSDVSKKVSSYEKHMQRIPSMYPDTVGAIIGVGDRIISVDIFASSDIFQNLWPKLLKASAVEAISCTAGSGSVMPDDAAGFLRILHDKGYTQRTSGDAGVEFGVIDETINANALVFGGEVIHLAAFPQGKGVNPEDHRSSQGGERRIRVMQPQDR